MTPGDDDLPRLPPSSHDGSNVRPRTPSEPVDLGAVHQTDAAVRRVSWTEYREPELLSLRTSGLAVLGARVALALWAVTLVVVAVLIRFDDGEGSSSTATATLVGSVGWVLAAVAAGVGWHWTDRATQNAHLLEARFPSRRRCVSGWAWPLVWVALLTFTVLRLEPTELVDVRPAIAAVIFAVALWRPYSLVRRILKSLIRVDSDLTIGSAYLLDLALFGLVWGRLASLPSELGPADAGVAGSLLGLSAVAAIAAIGNVGVWYLLVRDVDRAVAHRRLAMRTRHEHRQLRLAGINPLDPRVRFALHTIHQEAHRADVAQPADDAPPDRQRAEPASQDPSSPASSDVLPTKGGPSVGAASSTEQGLSTEQASSTEQALSTEQASSTNRAAIGDGNESRRHPLDRIAGRVDPDRQRIDTEPAAGDGSIPDRPVPPPGEVGEGRDVADIGRGRDGQAVEVPPSGRFVSRSASANGEPPADPVERLTMRLADESAAAETRSVLDRLERLGITAGGAVIPDDGTGRRDGEPDPAAENDLMVERLTSLELARYLLVIATAACAAAAVWFVLRSVDVGEIADGTIAAPDLDRLEAARVAVVRTLAIVLALVPLWCAATARWASRVGLGIRGTLRCAALTVVAGVLVGVGLAADPASGAVPFVAFGLLGASMWSIPVMIEVERRLGRSTVVPALLPLTFASSVVVAWSGGLLRPLAATDSMATLSFSGGLLAVHVAIAVVVVGVSTSDVVDAIKLSPPARRAGGASTPDER